MSEYLLPFNSTLNIEEKRKLFEVRNRMTRIPYNFGNKEEKCICGALETMQHIYCCEYLNQEKPEISYESIYNGNLKTQMEIFKRFRNSLESRNKIKNGKSYPPGDLRDPLSCINLDLDDK